MYLQQMYRHPNRIQTNANIHMRDFALKKYGAFACMTEKTAVFEGADVVVEVCDQKLGGI